MEIPSGKGSWDNFWKTIASHVDKYYERVEDDKFKCKNCGTGIEQTTGFVSIHYKMFDDCTGGGEVKQIPIPFCPICEGVPKNRSSCVHI